MTTGPIRREEGSPKQICNELRKEKPIPIPLVSGKTSKTKILFPQTDCMRGKEEKTKTNKRRRFPESKEIMKQTLHCCSSVPSFSDELIHEILSRLPVKSLLRFKCASKSWKTLILDPYFVKLHLHRSSSNSEFTHHRLIPCRYESTILDSSLPSLLRVDSLSTSPQEHYPSIQLGYRVVGACDGLLCLSNLYLEGVEFRKRLFFLNPATRVRSRKSPILFIYRGFCDLRFGFGYDNMGESYKVVALYLKSEKSDNYVVKVFSLKETRWRKIEGLHKWSIQREASGGVNLSGTLNWVAAQSSNLEWGKHTMDHMMVIVSLDLGNETWKQLSLPSAVDEEPYGFLTLGVFKGCLCFCHGYKKTHFVVWQMKEFGVETSWTQLIKVDPPLNKGLFDLYHLLLLGTSRNGEFIIGVVYLDCLISLYKWKDNVLELYQLPRKIHIDILNYQMYSESLVIPH